MNTFPIVLLLLASFLAPAAAQESAPGGEAECPVQSGWRAPARIDLAAVPAGLRVSWMLPPAAPTDVAGFQIVRAEDLNGPYEVVGLAGRSVTEFIDTTADPGTIYYYQVRAFRGGVCTPFSEPVFGQR